MEETRGDEVLVYKHVCKLCNKRYPTGKSLGGHMRSHVIANAKKNKHVLQKSISLANVVNDHDHDGDGNGDDGDDDDDDEMNGGDQKSSGYVLRENPKKTWRLVDATLTSHNSSGKQLERQLEGQGQDWVCKQCGKGFHSLKALCGHMSSHSEKEKNFKEQDDDDISWSSDSKEHLFLAMESHSDNHNNNNNSSDYISKRQTRSSLSKSRSVTANESNSPGGDCGGGGGGGGSSSNQSEIDQLEQEEVAICLMMLSRDSSGHNKTCCNFGAESSNDSVILEGGSFGGKRKDLIAINDNKVVAKNKVNVMNNSDSGYFENGAKELESDGNSVDGFVRNYGFKKPKTDIIESRIIRDSIYNDDNDSMKRTIREISKFNFESPEYDDNNNNNRGNSIKKGGRYECSICDKSFRTHQALGGHIISHRKTGYNSLDTSISAKHGGNNSNNLVAPTAKTMVSNKAKKVKGHKCPYCPRVFKSGQALGGHKRTHTIEGGSRAIVNLHLEAEQQAPPPEPESEPEPEPEYQQPHLIDLNLPAPMED